jgi:hypothetical protein
MLVAALVMSGGVAEARQARPAGLEPGARAIEIALPEGGGSGTGLWWVVSPRTQVGVEAQLGYTSEEVTGTGRQTRWSFGAGPALKRQIGVVGPVLPYWRAGAMLQTSGGSGNTPDASTIALHGGIGADWFVHERASIGRHTGLRGGYSRISNTLGAQEVTRDAFSIATFRSALVLSIHF